MHFLIHKREAICAPKGKKENLVRQTSLNTSVRWGIPTIFQAGESFIKVLMHLSRVKYHISMSTATQTDKLISNHAIILLKEIKRYENKSLKKNRENS